MKADDIQREIDRMTDNRKRSNDILQWLGAAFIIIGHVTNAIGPSTYPWNIVAFTLGTAAFLTWAVRILNRPQMLVNIVALVTCIIGLVTAWR
jgi:energy-converting hydrogenase Eha subunit E